MHISIFKTKFEQISKFVNYYDYNHTLGKGVLYITLLFLVIGIFSPAPTDYLSSIRAGYSLYGFDNLYDYTFPMISVFIVFFAFLKDYINNRYELIIYFNASRFNYNMLFRWGYFVFICSLSNFITATFYYRFVSFLDLLSIVLSLRFVPNILFLTSLLLFLITLTKNCYAALFVVGSYLLLDFLSSARMFKWFSLGVHSSNYYCTISPAYYLLNRALLVILSVLFVFIACKISAKENL